MAGATTGAIGWAVGSASARHGGWVLVDGGSVGITVRKALDSIVIGGHSLMLHVICFKILATYRSLGRCRKRLGFP